MHTLTRLHQDETADADDAQDEKQYATNTTDICQPALLRNAGKYKQANSSQKADDV